jgi:glycine dehydrogenase subunit 2
MNRLEPVSFDTSVPGRRGCVLPPLDVAEKAVASLLPGEMLRREPACLPELSEVDVVRHFTRLSQKNFAVDEGFYPLGSCTMKYNPKCNEDAARLPGFALAHPLQGAEFSQGALRLMYELTEMLTEITGMAGVSLQPAAGAHGYSPWDEPGLRRPGRIRCGGSRVGPTGQRGSGCPARGHG